MGIFLVLVLGRLLNPLNRLISVWFQVVDQSILWESNLLQERVWFTAGDAKQALATVVKGPKNNEPDTSYFWSTPMGAPKGEGDMPSPSIG